MDFLNYPPHPDGPAQELRELLERHRAMQEASQEPQESAQGSENWNLAQTLARRFKRVTRRSTSA